MNGPAWELHRLTFEAHRTAVRNSMERLWADVAVHLPHTEDDPYYQALRRQVEDSHSRLFELLNALETILQAEANRPR